MKIYRVSLKFAISRPVFVVVNDLNEIQSVVWRKYPDAEIIEIELVSNDVINVLEPYGE